MVIRGVGEVWVGVGLNLRSIYTTYTYKYISIYEFEYLKEVLD